MIPNGGVVSDGEVLRFLNPDDRSGPPLIEYPMYAVSEMFGVAVQETEHGRTCALAMRFGSAAVQSIANQQESTTGAQGGKVEIRGPLPTSSNPGVINFFPEGEKDNG